MRRSFGESTRSGFLCSSYNYVLHKQELENQCKALLKAGEQLKSEQELRKLDILLKEQEECTYCICAILPCQSFPSSPSLSSSLPLPGPSFPGPLLPPAGLLFAPGSLFPSGSFFPPSSLHLAGSSLFSGSTSFPINHLFAATSSYPAGHPFSTTSYPASGCSSFPTGSSLTSNYSSFPPGPSQSSGA